MSAKTENKEIQATIGEGTLVNWFKEHNGYEVKETK